MSIALFREALAQEVSNLIENGCKPDSVYEYAFHKAEGAAFFAMLNGYDYHTELTNLSRVFGGLLAQEKHKARLVSELAIV